MFFLVVWFIIFLYWTPLQWSHRVDCLKARCLGTLPLLVVVRSRTYQMCGCVAEEKIVGKFFLQHFVWLLLIIQVSAQESPVQSLRRPPHLTKSPAPSHILLAYLSTFFGLLPHWTVSSIIARICFIHLCVLSTGLMVYTANKYEWVWVVLFQTGSHLSPSSEAFGQQRRGEQFGHPFPNLFLYLHWGMSFSHIIKAHKMPSIILCPLTFFQHVSTAAKISSRDLNSERPGG